MKDKLCPRCHGVMIIDEWSGWIWICCNCGVELDPATPEEIAEWEKYSGTWTKEEIKESEDEAEKLQNDLNWK